MSFHLEGPWLSTTGKKRGKPKFRTAEQAQTARRNKDAGEEMMKKWGIEQEERKRKRAMSSPEYKPSQPYRES